MIKTIPVISTDTTKKTASKTSLNKDIDDIKVDKFNNLLSKQTQQDKDSATKQEFEGEVKEPILDESVAQDITTQTNSQLELDSLLKKAKSDVIGRTNTTSENDVAISKDISENVSTIKEEKKSVNIKISSTLDLDGHKDNGQIQTTLNVKSGQLGIQSNPNSTNALVTKLDTVTEIAKNTIEINDQEVQSTKSNVSKEVVSPKKSAITVKKVENSIDSPIQTIVDMGQLALLTSDKFNNSMQIANGAAFLSQNTTEQADELTVSQGKELNQLASSILSGVKTLDKIDSNKITIQLTPKNLGKMEVSFHSDNKQVSLEFKVETTQTKQILESVSDKLQNILEKQGLNNLDSTVNTVKSDSSQIVNHLSEANSSSFDTQTMFDQSGAQRQFSQEQQDGLSNRSNKHDYKVQEAPSVEQKEQENKISILA